MGYPVIIRNEYNVLNVSVLINMQCFVKLLYVS